MMGQDPNAPPRNVQFYEQQEQQRQHQEQRRQQDEQVARSHVGPQGSGTSSVASEYHRQGTHPQYSSSQQQLQQGRYQQQYPQQYPHSQQWGESEQQHTYPHPISEHGWPRGSTRYQERQLQHTYTASGEQFRTEVQPQHQQSVQYSRQSAVSESYVPSLGAGPQHQQQQQQPQPAASGMSLSPSYTASEQVEFEARSLQVSPTALGLATPWRPRAASAPSPVAAPAVPMFGERLQQRAAMQLSNIPHVPNIVVDAVQPRDPYGHSRTPPFVQSDWSGSQWGLSVPSSNKKMRTNSDSAIYEAEKEQQQQQLGAQSSGYIPTSWELLSFHQSPSSEDIPREHIRGASVATAPSSATMPQHQTVSPTYQPRSQQLTAALQSATPNTPSLQPDASAQPPTGTVAMETECSQASSPVQSQPQVEEPMEALNLKYQPPPPLEPIGDPPLTSADTSKPTVPFIWKFQSQKSSQSPKTYWLRRHSDSTLPSEPEDLRVPKSSSARSLSTGDSYAKVPIIEERETAADTGIESGGATGSSTSGAEGGDIPSPRETSGDLLSKRLKLKKYLQKRYQLSLESTLSRHSTESDDVFSPSPGIFGSSFSFSPTLVEGEISPGRVQRPSPLASSQSSLSRASKTYTEPLEIKTEPISPVSSESEGEGAETGVFMSPSFASPQSTAGPRSHGTVFQFHSPGSYRSSGSEKSTESSHRLEPSSGQIEDVRSSDILTHGPHVFTESTYLPMDTDPTPGTASSTPASPTERPNMQILRQGKLPPLASMLSHPSFTHPNIPSLSAPQTPPFMTYKTIPSQSTGRGSPTGRTWSTTSTVTSATARPPATASATPARVRSASDSDKPVDPSKIIYCPFSEKVQEQRYQREMTFLCPVCGQMFPSYNYLANHMVNHLPSEVVTKGPGDSNKVHLCKVCNRSFSRSDMLTRHMRLHTGLRPYECRMCGQVFSRSDHLHTHLRTHTGEKPYRCPQCPYAAPRRDMITRHMRIHTKHFSRRGRRTSSTGSADTQQSSSFSSLESGDSDLRKRNQSLSSVGSEGSMESPFRHGSGTSSVSVESDVAGPPSGRHWSATSGESMESGADYPASTPSSKYSRNWSLTSIESVDVPVSSPQSGQSTPQSGQSTPQVATPSSTSLHTAHHRAQRSLSAASADSGGTDESRTTPVTMEMTPETPTGSSDVGEQAEMQTSFQKCQVTSDKDSSGSDMSPAGDSKPLPTQKLPSPPGGEGGSTGHHS